MTATIGYEVSFWSNENVELHDYDGSKLCEYTKNFWIMYFKRWNLLYVDYIPAFKITSKQGVITLKTTSSSDGVVNLDQ